MGHINYKEILEKAESYKKDISAFLRDMIAIPSESCNEEKVVLRIKEEMEKVGFDKELDGITNVPFSIPSITNEPVPWLTLLVPHLTTT